MYAYNTFDQQLLRQRIDEFSDQIQRYQNQELSEEQFKDLRLRNGLYLQRHAYMLRVAIPYGCLRAEQLHQLASIANDFDRGYGHFTTRQNIQFNWPQLQQVPEILQRLAKVQLHSIQTSGNCLRNITSDPLAGVAADEVADPRPYCELLRQWSTLHPEFSWLPRKFKVAIIGAKEDRAAIRFHDIGLQLIKKNGQLGFIVYVGGGLGRTPVIATKLCAFLPQEHLLSYIGAVLRVHNLYSRRDNLHRARLKILVKNLGIKRFRTLVDEQWQAADRDALALKQDDLVRMQAFFQSPVGSLESSTKETKTAILDPAFARWKRHNTTHHKYTGYRIVSVSLKAPGLPPGDMPATKMATLATLVERYSLGELRVSSDQNLLLPYVKSTELYRLWQQLQQADLACANIGSLQDVICCPGLDYCNLAHTSSLDVTRDIQLAFNNDQELDELGRIKLRLSGCVNACAHHHAGHIGILGADKNGEEWYQFTLGGSATQNPVFGRRLGPAVPKQEVANTVRKIITVYRSQRLSGESFLQTLRRIGLQPFQESVYEHHSQSAYRSQSLAASGR